MIDGRNFFDQQLKNNTSTDENRKLLLVKELITQLVACLISLFQRT